MSKETLLGKPLLYASEPPEWWPADKPFQGLDDRHIYQDQDGRWRHADGRIVGRAERRRAGVR